MRSKIPFGFVLLLSLFYIGFGDQLLPRAIGQYSFQTRTALDRLLISVFPNWRPKTNPSERTQDAVEKLENRNKKEN
jgi:hypothetical protein